MPQLILQNRREATNIKQEDGQVINEEAAAPVPSRSKSGLLRHENPPAQAYGEDSTDRAASANPKSAISATFNERKFNLVLYGMDECSEGTARQERAEKDRKTAFKNHSIILPSLENYSIRDCIRIGKYSPNGTRPRPLFVKFHRACDVSTILYRLSQGGLPAELSGIAIKHHMTPLRDTVQFHSAHQALGTRPGRSGQVTTQDQGKQVATRFSATWGSG